MRVKKSRWAKELAWLEQKIGQRWGAGGGDERQGERKEVGRKGIAYNESQTIYRTPFAHEREAAVHFDWLLVRQSKYNI